MKSFHLPRKFLILLFWTALWQAASAAVGNSILLTGPADVLKTLVSLAVTADFWKTIACSSGKIMLGFFLAFLAGLLLGTAAFRFSVLEDLLAPVISLMKSIPVASFVILALIWIGSDNLCIFISFLVVLPMIYVNTLAGLRSTDPRLLEMADVFQVPFFRRIRFLYLPALLPYLVSGCRVALGMSIKSGVAAEVIGTPAWSIGKQLYLSKTWLDTSSLFAWTLVIIAVSALFERAVLFLLDRVPCGTPYKEEMK
ncbi:MAG TPA: ABC transporter permease subunit [Candidatus Lachnoclostridium pullistercoris]|uniref:ABC transporter permease subunit n=1 Tax=Candidatus Lachnoclostridium pullistercoris TaxID=2838632 RepID=A0A9D2T6L7_9FIRM|nr:ABC transporter permease subunit [Candidatus Lachnoclostridium pullistercoris]